MKENNERMKPVGERYMSQASECSMKTSVIGNSMTFWSSERLNPSGAFSKKTLIGNQTELGSLGMAMPLGL